LPIEAPLTPLRCLPDLSAAAAADVLLRDIRHAHGADCAAARAAEECPPITRYPRRR